jgi:hypothetical protein
MYKMCDKAECYFISIITINDENEKVVLHYDKDDKVVFIQHFNPKDEIFREFEPK